MNGEKTIMKKKKKKRRKQLKDALFPLLLSAFLRKSQNNRALIKECLNKIYLSLPHSLSTPILSLLPSLLKSDVAEAVSRSAEIIGAASLTSFEMNERISAEDEILKTLISLLGSPKRLIALASCNAVLDLSTASIGRHRLIDFSAIDNLLLCFIQAPKTSPLEASINADTILLRGDEYIILLLQGAISLINSSGIDMLQHLPFKLSNAFLLYLKGLWVKVHKQRFSCTSSICDNLKDFYATDIRINNLAESIFRLSVNVCPYPGATPSYKLRESIFGLRDINLEKFLCTIWESSPMLVRDGSKDSSCQDDIFGPFLRYLGSEDAIPIRLPSILKCFVSCPPLASDELDIICFLGEMRNLGCPITYYQDIRVMKTNCGEREFHYFEEHIDDISRCKEALQEGFSIAVRGMECRFPAVAAIADGIASFFGQPSIGVNMYLTPPNCQGLACHTDDHCVFICQLIGSKKWTIYPRSNLQLPRLYESFDNDFEAGKQAVEECQQILLKEGDVLYIPRGFPHEARAHVNDELQETTGFSLHLTLAVEIEPPFEWEGFMQIAVYSWVEKQKASTHRSVDSSQSNLNTILSMKLLLVAVKLNADIDPTFRKACLVGAGPILSSITGDWFHKNQKTIFQYLINRIASNSNFLDVVRHVKAALQKNEDPLEHIRWMKCLTINGEITKFYDSNSVSSECKRFLDLLNQDTNRTGDAFEEIKSKFCQEVEFQVVEQHYTEILEKYREVRRQYKNGMLSLHSTDDREHEMNS